jgi:hypothetical protein
MGRKFPADWLPDKPLARVILVRCVVVAVLRLSPGGAGSLPPRSGTTCDGARVQVVLVSVLST